MALEIIPVKIQKEIDDKCLGYQGKSIFNYGQSMRKEDVIIKIPTCKFSEKDEDFIIEFSEYKVPRNPAILDIAYKKLFELKSGDNEKK